MPKSMQAVPTFEVDLNALLNAADSRRTRSRQVKIGPSDLGTCRRRTAYKLARQKADNFPDKGKAIMGTLLHKGGLAAAKATHGGFTEVRVEDEIVRGSADWLRWDPIGLPICSDLKTKGKDTYDLVIRRDISIPHAWQINTYADLMRRGKWARVEKRFGQGEGVDVVEIEVMYLCRDDGRSHTRRVEFDQAIADEARAWAVEVADRLERDGIKRVPRDQPGPDMPGGVICRNCPFVNACWGPQDPVTLEREALDIPDHEMLEWMEIYDRERSIESEAKKRKEIARGHLNAQTPVTIEGWSLGWTGGKVTTITEPDTDAAIDLIERAGLAVPMRTYAKISSKSIQVKPPKK